LHFFALRTLLDLNFVHLTFLTLTAPYVSQLASEGTTTLWAIISSFRSKDLTTVPIATLPQFDLVIALYSSDELAITTLIASLCFYLRKQNFSTAVAFIASLFA
jgi:hypothetical protein